MKKVLKNRKRTEELLVTEMLRIYSEELGLSTQSEKDAMKICSNNGIISSQ